MVSRADLRRAPSDWAAVGATRPPVDEGWAAPEQMIGASGKVVAPRLYIAVGISGMMHHTVGIRIPNSKICQALAQELNNPLITTSLNISGQKVLTNPNQITQEMRNKIELILDAGTLADIPSSIIDLTSDFPVIIREGKGSLAFLKKLI
jgi:tRNA threonylcarbamoyl adenosine modification protein (Sua5/YciO/YrdC/YwlC family)